MSLFVKSLLIAVMIAGFMVFFTTGCTQSIPEIEAGLKIPAPSFDQSSITLNTFYVPNADGVCHKLIKRIELKAGDQGWMDLTAIDPTSTVTCSTDGKFHFVADFRTGYLGNVRSALEAGAKIELQVRGFGDILLSEIGSTTLTYGPAQSNYNIKLASTRQNPSSGGNFVVSGEAKPNGIAATSTNYFVYGTLRSK